MAGACSIAAFRAGKAWPGADRQSLGDLALNREDIRQITIISLRPEMGVRPRINQLCIHPHPITGSLHASFQHMRNPELLSDLAQVAPVVCR